jgi:hypothetical protein
VHHIGDGAMLAVAVLFFWLMSSGETHKNDDACKPEAQKNEGCPDE